MKSTAAGLAIAVIAAGCSLGPKEQWAGAIHKSQEVAREASTARVRMTVDVEVIETNVRQTPVPLLPRLEGVVDFRTRRALLVGEGDPGPSVFFDDLVTFLPRSSASRGNDDRQWASYDFVREPSKPIDDNDRRLAVGAGLLSPALVVELLPGVLTGSVEQAGTERVSDISTTRYAARLSPDSAAREIDNEDRREGLLRIFEAHGVREDVFPVQVWVGDDGLVRRVGFVMRQQKDRVNSFELRVMWEFFDYGADAEIAPPRADETVGTDRFYDFIVEFIRQEI